jgi:hypothetical protein
MKTTTTSTIMAGLLALCLSASSSNAQQQSQGPIPVVITPRQLQYKVVDMGRIPANNSLTVAGTVENILNELAGQGWKLVTISGSLMILSR